MRRDVVVVACCALMSLCALAKDSNSDNDQKPCRQHGKTIPPKVLQSSAPDYTQAAEKLKIKGVVALGTTIEADGHVSSVKILKSLGFGLDEKAIESVKKWRFKPALKDCVPIAAPLSIEVQFRL
jgi:periplasmic protein TonB